MNDFIKVLWIVNTIFPYPAQQIGIKKTCFGGWLNGLAENLKKEKSVNLAIATVYNGKKILEFDDGDIKYYLLPRNSHLNNKKYLEHNWKIINEKYKPDVVHIHGTEYAHGLAYINASLSEKIIVSIQGLVYRCADVYLGNIKTNDIIKNITFRDIIMHDNIFSGRKKFEKSGKKEIEMIQKSNYIIGRTTWDYSNVKSINPNISYFKCNETLRKIFYEKKWNINEINRYTIFCSQAAYPIKGFHYLIQAIYILKKKYPQIKLYVGGYKLINNSTIKNRFSLTGYGKYIKGLIKKYKLENNIIFLGELDEKNMLNQFLKSHVFVLPSVIENSSNSLGEAMLLGMPCVASNTGGTMDILEHKKEGYLFPYTEPAMCAEYISKFFENDELCKKMGMEARKTAIKRHDGTKNVDEIIKLYKKVLEN